MVFGGGEVVLLLEDRRDLLCCAEVWNNDLEFYMNMMNDDEGSEANSTEYY